MDGGAVIKMAMMNTEGYYNCTYISEIKLAALELPYKWDQFSFLILIPKIGVKLENLERKITAVQLASLVFFPTAVDIILPKFKVEASYELNEDLKALGINDFFDRSKANLTFTSPTEKHFVSKIIHKFFCQGE